jgi:hypothetical protein
MNEMESELSTYMGLCDRYTCSAVTCPVRSLVEKDTLPLQISNPQDRGAHDMLADPSLLRFMSPGRTPYALPDSW